MGDSLVDIPTGYTAYRMLKQVFSTDINSRVIPALYKQDSIMYYFDSTLSNCAMWENYTFQGDNINSWNINNALYLPKTMKIVYVAASSFSYISDPSSVVYRDGSTIYNGYRSDYAVISPMPASNYIVYCGGVINIF